MATDILKVHSNERIDVGDFEDVIDDLWRESARHHSAQFCVDPSKQRMWILGGFETTNPSGAQIQVDKGRAILASRQVGVIAYSILASEGDATKAIDASSYSDGTYGVYVKFEYSEGASASRIFWNPAGDGSEFTQTVTTRRLANWSMRAELSSPGNEWTKVAEFTVSSGSISAGPDDKRSFYFEGDVDAEELSGTWTWNGTTTVTATDTTQVAVGDWVRLGSDGQFFEIVSEVPNTSVTINNDRGLSIPSGATGSSWSASPYESGWSSEGGGVANDRHADRQQYGVFDLQTFVASMRQCVEDVKGRGLRRWWDKGIGGLSVGFDTDPVEDTVAVGDVNFRMYNDGTDARIQFDDVGGSPDEIFYDRSDNTWEFRVAGTSRFELDFTTGDTILKFDPAANDYLRYDVTANQWEFVLGGSELFHIGAAGLLMQAGMTTKRITFDTNDYLDYASDAYEFRIGGTLEAKLTASGWEDLVAYGGASNPGLSVTGGSNAPGISATGGTGGQNGVEGTGVGAGAGIDGTGGVTGPGGTFTAGGGGQVGVSATGNGGGDGIYCIGGSTGGGITAYAGASGNGIGGEFYGDGSGSGIQAIAQDTGYGALIQADTGATPTRSALRLVPQQAKPVGPNSIGDICVISGVPYLCTTAGTPGTFTSIFDGTTTI